MSDKGRLISTVGIRIVWRVNRSVLWGAIIGWRVNSPGSSHGFAPVGVTLGKSFHFSGPQPLPRSNTSAGEDDL